MSTPAPSSTQPGWYADPESPGQLRWFDGAAWSPFTKEGSAEPAPVAVPRQRATPATAHPVAPAPTVPTAPARSSAAAPVSPAPVLRSPAAWPSDVGRPADAPATDTAATVASLTVSHPVPTTTPRPTTPLRRLVGRLAGNLPDWLPEPVADLLRTRMTTYASRTDRLSEKLTAGNLKELVFPRGSAWQGSVAACLGLLTVVLSVWPLAGLGAWVVTCAFAGWALLRIRGDVLLGGKLHAWVGIACGIGPLWTGLLMVAYR